ncbi:hypothetical protein NVIE_007350 [Nitrososphaera viennensis EN76]|uniref:Uncharacterized protein n=1 Tax=Nitrososphaera viennensis EN76 TaxID=926571 RepID=A0A060HI40_9ARCH|nr:hypothetical protein NVIE_007350 [Nitrososphaera viennensis EN76]
MTSQSPEQKCKTLRPLFTIIGLSHGWPHVAQFAMQEIRGASIFAFYDVQ